MRSYDLSPLFRSSVGFDRMSLLLDTALKLDTASSTYPPHNITRQDENEYRITLAVAGFSEGELDVSTRNRTLIVTGRKNADEPTVTYLHRGIAGRAFERRFQLADHIRVTDANLENGLLHISLVRELPEALRPRTLQIRSARTVATAAQAS